MKKSMFICLPLALSIVGCGIQGSQSRAKVVDIKSISARAIDERESPTAKKSSGNVKKAKDTEGNYTLIRKGDNEIQLTVKLDNPKGESIDALEISCDDKGAKILVDGEYKDIDVSSSGRIVNWAQEDPYEKIFFIQTTSNDPLNVIKINDIKVNGVWQESDLDNNELEVYKLGDNELKKTFVTNTPNFYECKFDIGESLTNFTVDGATDVGDGHYKVTSNGKMSYSFDYSYNGKTLSWSESMDIELMHWEVDVLHFGNSSISSFPSEGAWWIWNLTIFGTDFSDFDIHVEYNNETAGLTKFTPAISASEKGGNNVESIMIFEGCNWDEIEDYSLVKLFANNINIPLN